MIYTKNMVSKSTLVYCIHTRVLW